MTIEAMEELQHPWEISLAERLFMFMVAETDRPLRVLEIGCWQGGSLRRWLHLGGTVVAVDDRMRNADAWVEWAEEAHARLVLLQGHSQAPDVRVRAQSLGPYDWVFLDADHQYQAAKADWDVYSPMVTEGGWFAFHDIRRYEHGDLDRLWAELAGSHATVAIHDRRPGVADWGGIGLVQL